MANNSRTFAFNNLMVETKRYIERCIREEIDTLSDLKLRFSGIIDVNTLETIETSDGLVDLLQEKGVIKQDDVSLVKDLATIHDNEELLAHAEQYERKHYGMFWNMRRGAWTAITSVPRFAVLCLRTVLTSRGAQLTEVANVFINLYRDHPEALKTIKGVLSKIGMTLWNIISGSVSFVVETTSLTSLKQLWKSYSDGSLEKDLKKAINEIKELQELTNGEEIDVTLTIDKQEYVYAYLGLVLAQLQGKEKVLSEASTVELSRPRRRHTAIVKCDFQTQKQKVIKDFHHWISVRRRTIRELKGLNLEDMTRALDEHHRNANIATAAGASTSVVGTGLMIGGFVSSFFTFGATIPIMIAGCSIATVGGITTFGAKMSEIVVSKTNIRKVEDTIAEDKQESAHLLKSLEQLDKLIEKYVDRIFDREGNLEDFAEEGIANVVTLLNFIQMTGIKIMETEQLNPLSSSARAVGAVLSATSTGVTAGTAGARIGTAVFDTLIVASRAAKVAGLVASIATLPIDAYHLVKSVRELRNHSPSEVADKIRGIQEIMVCPQEGEIPSLVEDYVKSKVAQMFDSINDQR